MGEKRLKIDLPSEIIRQIAVRQSQGVSLRELEEEFGVSRPVINRALRSELGREITRGITEIAVQSAVAEVRNWVASNTELALKALESNLREKKMDAVKEFFNILGLTEKSKGETRQSQSIQLILPGGTKPPKDVTNEVQKG